MLDHLLLVKLSVDQITKAKEVNGGRKKITHALLCGESGQMFGTDKQCMKYYSAWKNIFPLLFNKESIVDNHPITQFESTFNLVNILIEKHDKLEGKVVVESEGCVESKKKKRILARLFGIKST